MEVFVATLAIMAVILGSLAVYDAVSRRRKKKVH